MKGKNMKKRNIFFTLLIMVSMLLTSCGSSNQSVDGKWIGSLDLTKQFEDGIREAHPTLAEYIDFEDLVIKMDIAFVDGQMSIEVQEESVGAFQENFTTGMQAIALGYWEDGLRQIDLTLEEAISESGMTEEAYMQRIYKETGIDKMIESMSEITTETLDMLSKMKGTYTTPVAKELRLYHTEDKYESMEYAFQGKKLNITIKGDDFALLIQCDKSN